jgi:hypothetical protein|tara:strand:+ start:273 stop:422 length:150 start_codon:yes stop_codon:yes gene_type:complete
MARNKWMEEMFNPNNVKETYDCLDCKAYFDTKNELEKHLYDTGCPADEW